MGGERQTIYQGVLAIYSIDYWINLVITPLEVSSVPHKKRELQTDRLQYEVHMLEITGSARD